MAGPPYYFPGGALLMSALAALMCFHVARAATLAEVTIALNFVAKNQPKHSNAANAFLKVLKATKAGKRISLAGDLTFILPSNFRFVGYKFHRLTNAQTLAVVGYHILSGKQLFFPAKNKTPGTKFPTRSPGLFLQRSFNPSRLEWRVGGKWVGPRALCEVRTGVIFPQIYTGVHVTVHGVDCMLTPPNFKGGPYTTRPI